MTQNFIQPKGSLKTQVDISNMMQDWAKNIAQNQLQNQAQAQAEAVDPMRQTVNDLLKNKLLESVEMPKYTTLNDVLSANKGDKLGVFAEFLNNPKTMRTIGNLLPQYGYNPKTGKMGNVMEEAAQREEAQMLQDQKRAEEQLKEQNDIATALNSAFLQSDLAKERNQLQRDLAKEEMEFKKQENALNRALQREQLNATIAHQRAMEGLARERLNATGGGGVTGGASNLTPKQIQKNQEMLNSLNAVQSQMDRFANSFGKVRGRSKNAFKAKTGALLADAYARGGWGNKAETNFNSQRILLFNKIARELGGEKGVLSDQDIKRIEGSLPSLSDSLQQKKAKMQAIYDLLDDRKSQYNIGGNISSNNDPMGLGL